MATGVGIHGNASGKIGNVVGRDLAGTQVWAAYQPKVHNPRTPLQVANRLTRTRILRFAQRFANSIKENITPSRAGRSAFNEAMSLNKNLIELDHQGTIITDEDCGVVSRGQLELPAITAAASISGGIIITDLDAGVTFNGSANDNVYVGFCRKETFDYGFVIQTGKRQDVTHQVTVPATAPSGDYFVFAYLRKQDGSMSSNTLFLGDVTV